MGRSFFATKMNSIRDRQKTASRIRPLVWSTRCAFGLSIIPLLSGSAQAEFFFNPWENKSEAAKTIRITPKFMGISSGTNFDPNGALMAPAQLDSVMQLRGELGLVYSPLENWSLFTQFSWLKQDLKLLSGDSASAYGFGDAHLGTNVRVLSIENRVKLDLQLQWDFPLYSNANLKADGLPFLGDGSHDVTFGPFTTITLKEGERGRWLLAGGMGFTWRTDEFSLALPWSLKIQHEPLRSGLVFRGMVDGIVSLRTDPRGAGVFDATNDAGGIGLGGSYLVNAVNPTWINLRAQAGYQFDTNLTLLASFSRPIWGYDTPVGISFGGMLEVRLGPKLASNYSPEYQKSNKGFVQYVAEATVLEGNATLNLVKINKGSDDGIIMGQVFDFFPGKADSIREAAVARGSVTQIKNDSAVVTIKEFYQEVWIEQGFIARTPAR